MEAYKFFEFDSFEIFSKLQRMAPPMDIGPSYLEQLVAILLDNITAALALIVISIVSYAMYSYWYPEEKLSFKNHYSPLPVALAPPPSAFIDQMKNSNRNMVIFYGSQTGTAEEFANRLAKEAPRYGMKALASDLEEQEMESLTDLPSIENSIAVFCMATYGEGDPTDNANNFIDWLRDTTTELNGVNYAVFGLGNKTYEHYNLIGKLVDSRMEELGATRIITLGLGDDDETIEEDFISWKESFWAAVCERYNIRNLNENVDLRQYEFIEHQDMDPDKVFTGEMSRLKSLQVQKPPYDIKNPFLSNVLVSRELYRGERSCLHVELDISDSKLRFEPGDHVGIYPTNDPELVAEFGRLLNIDLDAVFSLKSLDVDSSKKYPFPCPTTFRTALSHYVDITSIPRTHILGEISDYAEDEDEKAMLRRMATAEGKVLYLDWVVRSCRNIIRILNDLKSLKPDPGHLLELLPKLQPRIYSISSSTKLHANTVHVTAVVVKYETLLGYTNNGVATGWMKRLQEVENPLMPIFIRRNHFKLPNRHDTPIIMIGPGTGLAPFRGFIQERHVIKQSGKPVGDTILYFGCRKQSEDYLYEDELREYLEEGTLTKLHVAFSRDQESKIYVTHLLMANAKEVWDVIKRGGHIYVCGDAKSMAPGVHKIVTDIIMKEAPMSEDDAKKYVTKMETQKKYSTDVWS